MKFCHMHIHFVYTCTFCVPSGVESEGGHDEEDGEFPGELQEEVRRHEAPTGAALLGLPQGQKGQEKVLIHQSALMCSIKGLQNSEFITAHILSIKQNFYNPDML